jgi:hypothetical protein
MIFGLQEPSSTTVKYVQALGGTECFTVLNTIFPSVPMWTVGLGICEGSILEEPEDFCGRPPGDLLGPRFGAPGDVAAGAFCEKPPTLWRGTTGGAGGPVGGAP